MLKMDGFLNWRAPRDVFKPSWGDLPVYARWHGDGVFDGDAGTATSECQRYYVEIRHKFEAIQGRVRVSISCAVLNRPYEVLM